MKLYENFEKAYTLLTSNEEYRDFNEKDCKPEDLEKDKIIDDMIKFFKQNEEYEKCSTLLKIKCWRHRIDKKYNL